MWPNTFSLALKGPSFPMHPQYIWYRCLGRSTTGIPLWSFPFFRLLELPCPSSFNMFHANHKCHITMVHIQFRFNKPNKCFHSKICYDQGSHLESCQCCCQYILTSWPSWGSCSWTHHWHLS
jgi:hypothetical protein